MNYNLACKTLNLQNDFNVKDLKNNYYSLALKHHPDRNLDKDTTEKFQNIQSAYNYLNRYIEKNKHNNQSNQNNKSNKTNNTRDCKENMDNIDNVNNNFNYGYSYILKEFLTNIVKSNFDYEQFIELITNANITNEILKKLPKTTILEFQNILKKYSKLLNVNKTIIDKIDSISNEYTKNDKIIVLTPTLSNLLNCEVNKLEFKNEIYYIPYWHHELVYDLSNNLLIIRCEPKLPDCASIDKLNNLYINLSTSITSIINSNNIDLVIDNKKYYIPIDKLKIVKQQRYEIKNMGIPLIDISNIYSVSKLGSIFVDITFTDIK
jgi:hypothetical protein